MVRKRGEMILSGKALPTPSSACTLYPPPFALSMMLQLQIVQKRDEVLILSQQDQGVRRIRLNQTHPRRVAPSSHGDSVGHYEGNTLVVDTFGVKVGPLSMLDQYGTPYSDGLHLVERFQLIDADAAVRSAEQEERANGRRRAVDIDPDYGKGVKVDFTVEDPGIFTSSWSGTVTYRRVKGAWTEYICSENVHAYYDTDTAVPHADAADF
jgi:hypothetical protein